MSISADVGDGFLGRITHAMDLPPRELARRLGIRHKDLVAMTRANANGLVEIELDPMWGRLISLVDNRIANLLAIKAELDRKLAADTQARLARRMAIERRRRRR